MRPLLRQAQRVEVAQRSLVLTQKVVSGRGPNSGLGVSSLEASNAHRCLLVCVCVCVFSFLRTMPASFSTR